MRAAIPVYKYACAQLSAMCACASLFESERENAGARMSSSDCCVQAPTRPSRSPSRRSISRTSSRCALCARTMMAREGWRRWREKLAALARNLAGGGAG
eukprot:1218543-Pleurochrysis_carterae.AAC.1